MVSSGKHHLVFRRSLDDKQTLQGISSLKPVHKKHSKKNLIFVSFDVSMATLIAFV